MNMVQEPDGQEIWDSLQWGRIPPSWELTGYVLGLERTNSGHRKIAIACLNRAHDQSLKLFESTIPCRNMGGTLNGQMVRLPNRVLELIEIEVEKVQNSFFGDQLEIRRSFFNLKRFKTGNKDR